MAQKGEEMTDTQVRLMKRIERTTAELIRLKRLCGEVEEATESIVSEIFGPPEKRHAQEQQMQQAAAMAKPQPCTVFAHAGTVDWVAKLNEEVYEVMLESAYVERLAAEADDDDVERLAEELTDVITVCTSWLYALGYDEDMRGEVQRRINEKNRERGYFGIN